MSVEQRSLPLCPRCKGAAPPIGTFCRSCGNGKAEAIALRAAHHECHAHDCHKIVPPSMFMCRDHWYMVPKPMRDRIWATYVRGQEIRKDPSDAYLEAAADAIQAVRSMEGK